MLLRCSPVMVERKMQQIYSPFILGTECLYNYFNPHVGLSVLPCVRPWVRKLASIPQWCHKMTLLKVTWYVFTVKNVHSVSPLNLISITDSDSMLVPRHEPNPGFRMGVSIMCPMKGTN